MHRTDDLEIPYTLRDRDTLIGIRADVKTLIELRSSHEQRITSLERFKWKATGMGVTVGAALTWFGEAIVKRFVAKIA